MIFVTVGTHEQQFNRLIEEVDRLAKEGVIKEEIVIQIGYSTYNPKYCSFKKLLSYDEMINTIKKARIIITHGGPASFLQVLQNGKIPIVVPRQKRFDEHINDHQLEFAELVKENQGNIIIIKDILDLEKTIKNYQLIIEAMPKGVLNNNDKFNKAFSEIINKII